MLSRLTLALLLSSVILTGCDKAPPTTVAAGNTAEPSVSAAISQYSAEQFFATKTYLGNDINHNASALLVASDESGVFNLYRVSLDGKDWQPLTQSVSDPAFPVSWFPNDDRLLYTADQGGNELNHIYLRELDGTVRDLTPGDKVKAGFDGWNKSRDAFYFSTKTNARFNDTTASGS